MPGWWRQARRQFSRLAAVAAVAGWPRVAWIAPLWLLVRRYRVMVWESGDGDLGKAPPATWERRTLNAGDLDTLVALNPHWDRARLRRRLREGCEGVGWWEGGKLAHARWQSTGSTHLSFLELELEAEDGDAVSIDAFTPAEGKRRGHYRAGLSWFLARARERGRRRCVFFVAWWNEPTERLLARFGARHVGTVDLWRLGPRRVWRTSGAVEMSGPRSARLKRD